MSAFNLALNIEFATLASILQQSGTLDCETLKQFVTKVTIQDVKLKNLISLYANFDSIQSITTSKGTFNKRADPKTNPEIDELDISKLTFSKSKNLITNRTFSGNKPIDGWDETGVQLIYDNESVINITGADFSRGKTAPANPAGGGRSRARRRPSRNQRRKNKSYKKHSS